jgi:hypothetical protein
MNTHGGRRDDGPTRLQQYVQLQFRGSALPSKQGFVRHLLLAREDPNIHEGRWRVAAQALPSRARLPPVSWF